MAIYPFPNQKLELGSTGRFVTDLQRELGVAVTGVFDFLTMCKVAIHKFENGLNHNDPTVDEQTWNSIFKPGQTPDPNETANEREKRDLPGVATVGQVQRRDDSAQPADVPGNPRATTTGVTTATNENSVPNAGTDKPREDQPTVTAAEQQATGGPAGGYTGTPTEATPNAPTPGAQAAGAESADNNPGPATP